MVGGEVIETIVLPDKVWINCREKISGDECAIYVERTDKSRCVSEGDMVWWQGGWAMWTPKANRTKQCGHRHHDSCLRANVDYDIRLDRIGCSGVPRPAEAVR